MGQKEASRFTLPGFSNSGHTGTLNSFSHPAFGRDDKPSQPSIPGDLLEGPIPGWDNVWIDLGGEG